MAVLGLEEIREHMKKELSGTIYSVNIDQIAGVYDETSIKKSLNAAFNFYSESDQDEWSNEYASIVNNIPVKFTASLFWDDQDAIFGTADITILGDIDIQGTNVNMDFKADQKSIIDLDVSNGMASKIQTIQEISGSMQAQGQTIPMSLTTDTTMTIIKKQ